ncbi:putative Zn-binding protein involved in type VI secretion [Bosea sp. BE125]|uniref:PAAR domain-containing protein n=1 Tax=Bosea sp. BE125 TaxID=2817909 RepID=UPI002858E524|nr:PAAR domain-containing protein [Bosea sp. BE125]MDR6871076.1 putative Zn-binding protein involved in type VI secretion [Bosea sp. BE125]
MPTGPAARIFDPVLHPLPPILQPGPGSANVLIGGLPAWRGIGGAGAAAVKAAKQASDATLDAAKAAKVAAAGTPGAPAAVTAEETAKTAASTAMSATITGAAAGGGGVDIHICATPLPLPPHGPGVVVDGSTTVMINGLPACRMGDTIVEALGPPNKIMMGCPTVIIGG